MDLLIQEWNFRVLLQQHLSQILDWQKKIIGRNVEQSNGLLVEMLSPIFFMLKPPFDIGKI
jgi:hypothetical protein